MSTDFAAFVLTHNRPDRVFTYKTLRDFGYTGRIVLIIDDKDPSLDIYKRKYKSELYVFNKQAASKITDTMDIEDNLRGVVYARNMCWNIAKDLDIKHFIVLDDDYCDFRHVTTDKHQYVPRYTKIKDLDRVFKTMLDFHITSGSLTVAMGQTGDYIGRGIGHIQKPKRKAMNSFICSADRPFAFLGRINEDVNAYVSLGSQGKLFFSIMKVALLQKATQTNPGGLTELYLDSGTYVKSFFTVMCQPSSVKVTMMNSKYSRLHHRVEWNSTIPCIISQDYRKGAE